MDRSKCQIPLGGETNSYIHFDDCQFDPVEKCQFTNATIESDEMRKTRKDRGSSWKPDFETRCIIDQLPNLCHLKLFSAFKDRSSSQAEIEMPKV